MASFTFSSITHEQLESIGCVTEVRDDCRFEPLFKHASNVAWDDELTAIIHRNDIYIDAYTEEEVKLRVIAPILRWVNFLEVGCEDWWERSLEATFGEHTIGGKIDCLLARGKRTPQHPLFFLQEFKPSLWRQKS